MTRSYAAVLGVAILVWPPTGYRLSHRGPDNPAVAFLMFIAHASHEADRWAASPTNMPSSWAPAACSRATAGHRASRAAAGACARSLTCRRATARLVTSGRPAGAATTSATKRAAGIRCDRRRRTVPGGRARRPAEVLLGAVTIEHHSRSHRISVQLQSTNAQTPTKTRGDQRPESKTNQQHREPCEICKTSIPGSNPGGASKIPKKIRAIGLSPPRRAISYCSEKPSNCSSFRRATSVNHCIANSCQRAIAQGRGFRDLHVHNP